ncbi:MAG: hypothetical protein ACYSTY_14290 [Planctomycetota bacterium]|jgi:hypothetical protein
MSENPIEKLIRDFQDSITRGTWDGIYGLDEAGLERVMECQADACVRAYADLYQIPADLDLDAFLERMKMGGSSKIEIRRDRNTIFLEELHSGQCVCPLVTREVIPLKPALCRCAVHWLRKLFERHVRGPVRVELVDSAALGSQNCVFRVEIDDPSPPSG